ncbi:MAG: PIN domain-containing protein [Deltaproteobacteria bacterium]|nr:PIN domain-containing protein [Deltaproteobacteria bacterium]
MRKNPLLVDTDILISYLNLRQHRFYLESPNFQVHYSAVTKKELLAKQGLSGRERQAIFSLLKRYRQIPVTPAIADRYAELQRRYPTLEREDALIAASAIVRRLPLLTGNIKHFRIVKDLSLLP